MSFQDEIRKLREKTVHGVLKFVIPNSVYYLWKSLKNDGILIEQISDFTDSRNTRYKLYYYELFSKVLEKGRYSLGREHTVSQARDIAFTLMDADPAYEDLFKDMFEQQQKDIKEGKLNG